MNLPLYLGDEASAAGWRLAGAMVRVCAPGADAPTLARALAEAMAAAPLVLVSAALAARLEPGLLQRALAGLAPLVLVVPDPQGQAARPDLAARLRLQLGLDA